MKKAIYILSLLFASLVLSCSDDDGAYFPEPSEFSVSSTEFNIENNGGDVELAIKAGNLGWSITSDQDWVSISNKFGSGDGAVKLSILKNMTGTQRTAILIVKPTFNLDPVNITIKQN